MPAHKSKNFRFRILDECFQEPEKKWTLEKLIDEVSQQLTDEFGVQKVSRRSIQYDIALMREKPPLGYNAPVVCIDGYYSYSDSEFSIKNERLSKPDIDNLSEVVNTLKQYKNYSHLGDVLKIIEKIEAIITINPGPNTNTVSFETNDKLEKGITWLKQIFDAVVQKRVIELTLREKNDTISYFVIHPYFIKEHIGEWYLFGLGENKKELTVIPVQKIAAISPQVIDFIENEGLSAGEYFNAIIGVTPAEGIKPIKVTLKVSQDLTVDFKQNPIHSSQEISDLSEEGALITLNVIPNKDLRQLILKHGTAIKVESPDKLRKSIIDELKESYDAYFKLSLF